MDALTKAIDLIGSQTALAKAIGSTSQTVNNWIRRGNVPADRCPAIELATAGAVTCEELRPDIPWSVLRNGAAPDTVEAA